MRCDMKTGESQRFEQLIRLLINELRRYDCAYTIDELELIMSDGLCDIRFVKGFVRGVSTCKEVHQARKENGFIDEYLYKIWDFSDD